MLLTRNWLSKFMDLSGISNDEISIALNSLGFEVEETIDYSKLNGDLVVGYIKESKKIPDTHLSVNQVQVGQNKTIQIVCGAPNVAKGQFVIVAQVGVTIANGLTMSVRELKGYESHGMICALDEIGISSSVLNEVEKDSIYEINSFSDLTPMIGKSLSSIGFNDYVWDVDLTLNRSDALSAVQLLKELGNYFKVKVNYYRFENSIKNNKNKSSENIEINKGLEQFVNTAGYSTFIIHNNDENILSVDDDLFLKFNKSIRTDNYVYDLANKMAIEVGQPVILVDYDKIKADKITLTKATIDEKELVVLKDGGKIINVIGQEVEGKYKVTFDTKRMIALYFNFDPSIMRKQQKALNISNVALQRYMKPIYANKFDDANEALKDILDDYALIDMAFKLEYVKGPVKDNNKVTSSLEYINKTLGTDLSFEDIENIFEFLDFEVKEKGDHVEFTFDPNRIDIFGEKEICEEIARLYGYENIPATPLKIIANENTNDLKGTLESKVTEYLIGKGLNNIKTYSLISEEENKEWNLFGLSKPIKLMSPLSKLHEVYRLNLSKSIIDTAIYNSSIGNKDLKMFEIADIYYNMQDRERHMSIMLSGEIFNDFREIKKVEADYYYLKGILEEIFNLYNIDPLKVSYELQEEVIDAIHPYINAKIKISNRVVGYIYKLNPKFENVNKINKTFVAEINLDVLFSLANEVIMNEEISKFQSSSRDISLEVPNEIDYQTLIKTLLKDTIDVVDYKVIDIYQDDEMKNKNIRSISISFKFNNVNEQLNEEMINERWEQILNNVNSLGLKVR